MGFSCTDMLWILTGYERVNSLAERRLRRRIFKGQGSAKLPPADHLPADYLPGAKRLPASEFTHLLESAFPTRRVTTASSRPGAVRRIVTGPLASVAWT